jgi:hypothetical protein
LALPEDDLSVIENLSEADKSCGIQAWMTLVDHYKDDGIYCLTELLQDMKKAQEDDESSLWYMNYYVRLQRQLARVGEDLHDQRVIMYFVKGFKKE